MEDFKTLKKRIKFRKLPDGKIRLLDFCDCTDKYWFYLKPILAKKSCETICLLIKLEKDNFNYFDIGLTTDEGTGFTELSEIKDEEIKRAVMERISYLVDRGFIRIKSEKANKSSDLK